MTSEQHLAENMEIFDFELSEDDVNKISSMDKQARFYDAVPVERYNWIPITM
jgi:diketogulonate reductase-like aldo/keto reductase